MDLEELREIQIERPAMKYAESRGWFQDKIMKTSKNSFPDRYLIRNGRTILIEFKRPNGEPRLKQDKRRRELIAHGAEVFVIDSLEEVKRILK